MYLGSLTNLSHHQPSPVCHRKTLISHQAQPTSGHISILISHPAHLTHCTLAHLAHLMHCTPDALHTWHTWHTAYLAHLTHYTPGTPSTPGTPHLCTSSGVMFFFWSFWRTSRRWSAAAWKSLLLAIQYTWACFS